ncbi:MAG: 3-phosphoshikimate 1-carboxyvinyltransferase, partial [Selenomonadaceae bacterium]|nr:3-phosphoshikimate 1-carboxyvinyltransferase [Selenomonadaceae bacterium]
MNKKINKIQRGLVGKITVPGDKSISHRSVMLAALGDSPVKIENFLKAADTLSTVGVMRELGAKIEFSADNVLTVKGNGLCGLKEPQNTLDAGNSGTTLRLLMGLLAGANISANFIGDASLSKRPMKRITDPLALMGAKIETTDGKLPIKILKTDKRLKGIEYKMPVASAQLKSALLLAGLFAEGETKIIEPNISRDHTERMLAAFGAKITRENNGVTIKSAEKLSAPENIFVPGDISSAAYFIVAALIIPCSDLIIENIGVNPTRTGIIDILKEMGANIALENTRVICGEEIADIHIKYGELNGVNIGKEIMGRLIDEIPIIAVAAAFAKGETKISGAEELRVKETDRIKAVATSFNKFTDGMITETDDGMIIKGGLDLNYATADSFDDHRMAMSLAILGA